MKCLGLAFAIPRCQIYGWTYATYVFMSPSGTNLCMKQIHTLARPDERHAPGALQKEVMTSRRPESITDHPHITKPDIDIFSLSHVSASMCPFNPDTLICVLCSC